MVGNWLAQIGAVTVMNLRNIRERASSTLVALLGVTGVVTVVVGVLSISEGFRAVLQRAGADDVVVVLRGGEKVLPRALMLHDCGSSSSKSIGVMRTIFPSLT